ncbi:class I SAM-dependent methyltransferase [Kaarinaea lacus]
MGITYKDYFSGHSAEYQKFRPTYPDEMFAYFASLTPQHETAWDTATGNGQAAISLARWYKHVVATDASEKQIASASHVSNVYYQVSAAENTNIPDKTIDLITVAQALHWFNTELFFEEAKRVLKPEGIIAVWCYKLLSITPAIDAVVNTLYDDIIGNFWPEERSFIENDYADIAFPFKQLESPGFTMRAQWNLAALRGYLSTWSAVQKFMTSHGSDPLAQISDQLNKAWGDPDRIRQVTWCLNPKLGIHM